MHQDLCWFLPGGAGVALKPNPLFYPKVMTVPSSDLVVSLKSPLLTWQKGGGKKRSLVCPVRALEVYITWMRDHRTTDQLFICLKLGRPLSKARLSPQIVDVTLHAYKVMGVQFPSNVRARSTRGVAAFWAL